MGNQVIAIFTSRFTYQAKILKSCIDIDGNSFNFDFLSAYSFRDQVEKWQDHILIHQAKNIFVDCCVPEMKLVLTFYKFFIKKTINFTCILFKFVGASWLRES